MATKNVRNYLKLHRKYAKLSFEERTTDKAIRLYDKLGAIWDRQLSVAEMDEIDAILGQKETQ